MNSSNLILTNQVPPNNLGDSYLKFQLNHQALAVLSLQYIQEVVVMQSQLITPMPNMPECILGLMNWRSKIFWAINLPRMLCLHAIESNYRQYNIIVIRTEAVLLGLVVQSIQGTTRIVTETIQSPIGQVSSGLVPYLRGCYTQGQDNLLVLDAPAIATSAVLHGN